MSFFYKTWFKLVNCNGCFDLKPRTIAMYYSISVKYEEPQAIEGLAGALDTRQQNTGAIPVTQANLMDDIEQWLSTDVKGELDNDSEGVTSEEFDKFLEERAKAAEQLPTLPSPPTEAPGSVTSTKKKQQEKMEDALFTL